MHSPQIRFYDDNWAFLQHPLVWQEKQHRPVENKLFRYQSKHPNNDQHPNKDQHPNNDQHLKP